MASEELTPRAPGPLALPDGYAGSQALLMQPVLV